MKIAVDTNVLVRIVTQDDPVRVKKAYALIERYDSREVFICHVVLLETYFVLRKKYALSKEEILEDFEELLKIPQFCFEYESSVRLGLSKAVKGYGFNDVLIGEIGAARNLKTHTFDTGLKENKNFEMIH